MVLSLVTENNMADKSPVASKIKEIEKEHETIVAFDDHLIVRIDGHKFSRFTKGFNKPFDVILSKSMEQTAIDLVNRFGAVTAYTQSDEITLVFPSSYQMEGFKVVNNQMFGGRTQKMASLIAAYTSIRFNHWLHINGEEFTRSYGNDNYINTVYSLMLDTKYGTAFFDARIFGVSTDEDAYDVIKWRMIDALKNSKSMFAQAYCSHKSLLNKHGGEQIKFCLEQTNNDWYSIDDRYKYGVIIKKESYMKETVHGMTERTKVSSFVNEDFINTSDENINLAIRKLL